MKIFFRIQYSTQFGQNIQLVANYPLRSFTHDNTSQKMHFMSHKYWGIWVEVISEKPVMLEYYYELHDENTKNIIPEFKKRTLMIDPTKLDSIIEVFDIWSSASSVDYVFDTDFFRGHKMRSNKKIGTTEYSHQFTIKVGALQSNEQVGILGDCAELGLWDVNHIVPLFPQEAHQFVGQLTLSSSKKINYKYVIFDSATKKILQYESGENRQIETTRDLGRKTIIDDETFRYENIRLKKAAGVSIPVFSLRSEKSFGIGEFSDLPMLADWAVQSQLQLIQILPINDTSATNTWIDSYPYAAISVFALHPIYIRLEDITVPISKGITKEIQTIKKQLNSYNEINYEEVISYKWRFLRILFNENIETIRTDKAFVSFCKKNKEWLLPYSVFCIKRDEYGTPDFSLWDNFSQYNAKEVTAFSKNNLEVLLHQWVQYQLHIQLLKATKHLSSHSISLKGDIAIGIYRHSCDAWVAPSLYHMDQQAGAPPDDFAVKGQNWGFPTYNWEAMAKDGYQWWKMRLKQLEEYFDSFRIDHILGFFRIWQIPVHAVEGILGYFEPAIPFTQEEINQKLGWFNYDRLCKPYLTQSIINHIFGENAELVCEKYLIQQDNHCYILHPSFDTQKKIMEQSSIINHRAIQQGLLDCCANVLFIEGKTEGTFHPRFELYMTQSYVYLDHQSKQILYDLYQTYFYHRQENFWKQKAYEKLPMIKNASNLLICGEDLGMVPNCVPEVMQHVGILSLEVERMSKNPADSFVRVQNAPYMSVVSPASHDTSTLRQWWLEDAQKSQEYYSQILHLSGQAPRELTPELLQLIIQNHFMSPAMLAVFPIQEYLALDTHTANPNIEKERINIPANIPHYWQYRMHITIEKLLEYKPLSQKIAQLINSSQRY